MRLCYIVRRLQMVRQLQRIKIFQTLYTIQLYQKVFR